MATHLLIGYGGSGDVKNVGSVTMRYKDISAECG
jgi:hypothetical protein